jgi:MarR family transcriptional regulator, organic hydroperoxide resistance regulator
MKKEETLDYVIKSAWHNISRMYNAEAAQHEMSTAVGYVLLNIDLEKGTPATKIAPQLGLESRSLTRILKNLEEKGWIYRRTDRKDKRFVKIFLTEEGRKKRETARKTVKDYNYFIRKNIPEEKLNLFFEVMGEMASLTEHYRQELVKNAELLKNALSAITLPQEEQSLV